jgi:hypothetical protein
VKLETLKKGQLVFYENLKRNPVYCPVIGDSVFFNSGGWQHLLYKPNRKNRTVDEQYLKLSCLIHVPDVIKDCKGIAAEKITKEKVKEKVKEIREVALVSENKQKEKIKVIIQKVGSGKYTFRSVMRVRVNKKTPK